MILAGVALWAYALPQTRPLAAREGGTRREGLILRLTDEAGRQGWGEAAPLPGHGSETLEAARAGLGRLAGWQGRAVPEAAARLDGSLGAWLAPLGLGLAARCAAEAAIAGLLAARAGVPLHRLLWTAPADAVPVAGLIDRGGTPAEVGARAAALAAAGHRAIKLKVGGGPLGTDIETLATVAAAAPGVALRLDANRAWPRAEAPAALAALGGVGASVAYVEEPLAEGGCLAGSPLPLALDETLVGLPAEAALALIAAPPRPAAVVLKPMLLGFETALRLARAALTLGIAPVVGSSFESGLGLRAAAAIAAGTGAVAGLGTAPWFAADTVAQPDPAMIDLASAPEPDPALLEPLDALA